MLDARLRMRTVYSDGAVTWRDITLPEDMHVAYNTKLVYDGKNNIFLTRNYNKIRPAPCATAVHVLSSTGQYEAN